jgi:hypothetical protein
MARRSDKALPHRHRTTFARYDECSHDVEIGLNASSRILDRASCVEDALSGFTERRYERCGIVVENSLKLGDMERLGLPKDQHEI